MPIITLTTDFGLKDFYAAAVKGMLLKNCPAATIVDITHEIPVFNYGEAAFIVKNVWEDFPPGTIHIISVNSLKKNNEAHVIVLSKGHYFIGTDNGMFTLILEEQPEAIIEIESSETITFPAKDVFAKAACRIAAGEDISAIGKKKDSLVTKVARQAYADANAIKGEVVYLDRYENAVTNIKREQFEASAGGRPFSIQLRPSRNYASAFKDTLSSFNYTINRISGSYSDVTEGEILALFNSSGLLEIAVNMGNAGGLLQLRPGEPVQVFFD